MKTGIVLSSVTATLEELGHGQSVDISIEFEATPGDPGCMYTRNGDGWPPTPATVELIGVQVARFDSAIESRRRDRSGWFDLADRIAFEAVEREWESRWREYVTDELSERYER